MTEKKSETKAPPTEEMTEKEPETKATVEQFGHKNPPVGPRTGKTMDDWRKDRDYENFNPTAEK